MRMTNMLHFTENHRFCVFRDFSLSSLDYKMLTKMYQPMVGAFAIGVYSTLYQQLEGDRVGFSSLEQQRTLFLSLDLEPGERGRKIFIEQTSKLEAVGLLQTVRRFLPESDDYVFEYQLYEPLAPAEFFRNQHLTYLLRDKVGKYTLLFLKDELVASEPEGFTDANGENLSVPFYELFRLNTQVFDDELEQGFAEAATTRDSKVKLDVVSKGFAYPDIIQRFPRGSRNRDYVEALKYRQDQLVEINIIAKKYELTLKETCALLDEDSVFDEDGSLRRDVLQYKANLYFRQGKKREDELERGLAKVVPLRAGDEEGTEEMAVEMAYYLEVPAIFQGQCDQHQYNMILRNDPYTKVLKRFFSQGSVPDGVLDVFEKIDLNYKLPEEVINVLVHYMHTSRRSWAKSSIEAVASDMLGKQVHTYEQAVEYTRDRAKLKERTEAGAGKTGGAAGGRTGGARGRGKSSKPVLPTVKGTKANGKLSPEEFAEMVKWAEKLDGNP
ncbi:DnaD domain protein [Gorillibacterium sp. CAU 1737]|uniref:DnaD domain protein n=1 Tax=Gorillibacterium sp. CAU 1737 TaxID=3140362 RepID=UPI0032616CB2